MLTLAWPGLASAAAYFNAGDLVSPGEAIESDAYAAGQRVSIRHPVGDDVFVAGNSIEITDKVGGDVFAAGNQIRIRGPVGGDIRTVGNNLDIESITAKDLFAAGSQVAVSDQTSVSGDAYLAGQIIEINGRVQGTTRIASENIVLGPKAVIAGDLITYGQSEPKITLESGAQILGERRHVTPAEAARPARGDGSQNNVLGWVLNVLTWFVVSFLLLLGLPGLTSRVIAQANARPWQSIGWGVLWWILLIPVSIMLIASVIGWPLAIALLALTAALTVAALGYAALIIGSWITRKLLKQDQPLNWQAALVGAVAIALIGLAPVIGWLAITLLLMLAFGAQLASLSQVLRTK